MADDRRGERATAEPSAAMASRRALLAAAATGAGLALAAGRAGAQGAGAQPAGDHGAHHGHGDHGAQHAGPAAHQALIDAALGCVNRGEVCLDHCIVLLSKGDTSLKDCIRTVTAMLPVCGAIARLAALDAKRLKELAKVCIDICADCEAECKKHQDHHAACKACADSCTAFIKEAGKLA